MQTKLFTYRASKGKRNNSFIKEINQGIHVHTAILADLQGPKIRIGELNNPIKLKEENK